jgi:hypothetical protein
MANKFICACVLAGFVCTCGAQAKDPFEKDAQRGGKAVLVVLSTATTSASYVAEMKIPNTLDLASYYDARPIEHRGRTVFIRGMKDR